MVLCTYFHERREECVELLVGAGAHYVDGPEMDILRGRIDLLQQRRAANPALPHEHSNFRQDVAVRGGFGGVYGGAPLHRPTLLHICAEFNAVEAARLLIAAGADVNARAAADNRGFGNQTPVFHTLTSNFNRSYPMLRLLIEDGDMSVHASIRVPRFGEKAVLLENVSPFEYVMSYPNDYQPGPGSGPDKGLDTKPHENVLGMLS